MARIVLGSWMVRYPLGGNLSWALQYLLGLTDLGHDVFFVEKSEYPNSCYDPTTSQSSDDCTYGVRTVSALLARFGLADKWCFVDSTNKYWGLSKCQIESAFKSADLFIDSGAHGSWSEESTCAGARVLIEGEPGFRQMTWAKNASAGIPVPEYDYYYSNGRNVGRPGNPVPTLGLTWGHMYSPVKTDLFEVCPPPGNAPYSTVMNWRAHAPLEFNGVVYGQKDEEFQKFLTLPRLTTAPIAVAVAGKNVPKKTLSDNGWLIRDAQEVTTSFESFRRYLSASRGEFSICKNVFVACSTGWFSDRSAAYLASGRPVVMQDTGFSSHLPVGDGLFAVNSVEEARDAIATVEGDYSRHSRKAREIAQECLEAKTVMGTFLSELGL